ncbi:hypothetical protein O3G_MSEX010057 [Manduca sexta]|uniref:Uncharacterized protein n=1 Tax=Manduca sexta TaxID=7130 RepID=A0A921ZFV7_MANSE|nr:hypothetical protein O3G_MSEX010057 [Manduca sexta]
MSQDGERSGIPNNTFKVLGGVSTVYGWSYRSPSGEWQGRLYIQNNKKNVINCEPIAISGTNSRLRADTKQKNPNITLPDPGFEPRSAERCRTAHAIQLRHRVCSPELMGSRKRLKI